MLELDELSPWFRKPDSLSVADDRFVRSYTAACECLADLGYIHYEISNWAQPGFECRHNLKYWTGERYRGYGVGAHSFEDRKRFWNTSSLADYARMVDSGVLPIAGDEVLTREMRLDEAFMLGLRRISGMNIWTVAEELGIRYPAEWFKRVDDLQAGGLISFDGTILKLTSAGWLVANGVIEELSWPTLLSTCEATP
jgi:oxygen-independent coproporphyrinogen-3 oxidase